MRAAKWGRISVRPRTRAEFYLEFSTKIFFRRWWIKKKNGKWERKILSSENSEDIIYVRFYFLFLTVQRILLFAARTEVSISRSRRLSFTEGTHIHASLMYHEWKNYSLISIANNTLYIYNTFYYYKIMEFVRLISFMPSDPYSQLPFSLSRKLHPSFFGLHGGCRFHEGTPCKSRSNVHRGYEKTNNLRIYSAKCICNVNNFVR